MKTKVLLFREAVPLILLKPRLLSFFFADSLLKIFLPHRLITSFLSGAPPPKENPGSTPAYENDISVTCKLNSFHMNGCAPGLALIERLKATRK